MRASTVLLLLGGLITIWSHAQLRLQLKQEQQLTSSVQATASEVERLLARQDQRLKSTAMPDWRQDADRLAAELRRLATDLAAAGAARPGAAGAAVNDGGTAVVDPGVASPPLAELMEAYARTLEKLPPEPSAQEQQILGGHHLEIRQALQEMVRLRQEALIAFMQSSRQRLDLAIWVLVAVMSCALYMALKGHSHLQELLVQPLNQIISRLRAALNNPADSMYLPSQEHQQLDSLANVCNTLLDEHHRADDANRTRLAEMRKTADCLIAVFPDPTLVLAGTREILLANTQAWEWMNGEAGKAMRQRLLDAIAAKTPEFESHGLHFALTRLESAGARTSPLLAIYQFRKLGAAPAPASKAADKA